MVISGDGLVATPTDFFCEHGERESRLLVMLYRPGYRPAAQTVVADGPAAEMDTAARLLGQAAVRGQQPPATVFGKLLAAVPVATAEVLREAAGRAASRRWPVAAHMLRALPVGEVDVVPVAADARLADVPGPVVRVVRLVEVHVHDPERLLDWVAEDGWEPAPPEDRLDDDPRDLAGAVMFATDELPPLLGAKPVTQASRARLLDTSLGDEVLDWSPTPVVADFGSGWRQRR